MSLPEMQQETLRAVPKVTNLVIERDRGLCLQRSSQLVSSELTFAQGPLWRFVEALVIVEVGLAHRYLSRL